MPDVMSANRLVVVKNPFDRRERDVIVLPDPGRTVESLVGEYIPAGIDIDVSINGLGIAPPHWAGRTLAPGEELLVLPHVAGGGSSPLGAILAIAVMVAAPWLAVEVSAGLGLGLTAGSVGLMMLQAGIGIVGSMLIGALTAPSKPNLPSQGSLQSYDNSPAYAWNPATVQQPGAPIARAYGLVKLYGNIIAGYIDQTDETGKDQTAHLLIDLGMGPYKQLTDFQINDQPYADYKSVVIEERRGYLSQPVIAGFEDTRAGHSIAAKVVKDSPVTRDTVGSSCGALEVVLACPQGLWHANTSGGMEAVSVIYKIEYSIDAGAHWTAITHSPNTVTSSGIGYWSCGYLWQEGSDKSWHYFENTAISGSTVRGAHYEGEAGPASPQKWKWVAQTQDIVTVVNDTATLTASTPQPIRRTFRIDGITPGTACKVRVTNYSIDQSGSTYGDDLYFSELNEVILDDFTYPRTVLVGIRALATDQLSGSMRFSCLAEAAIVRVWNGSAWSSDWSRNQAWVTWDILTQPVLNDDLTVNRYDGMDPSGIDLVSFYGWAQFCDTMVADGSGGTEKRCLWDGVYDTSTDMWAAALEVCATARATLVRRGTTVAVVWDCARSTPAQFLTSANSSQYAGAFLPLSDRASTIEVDYVNAAAGYQRDQVSINNTAVAAFAGAGVAAVSLRGVTRASQAWREATWRLLKNQHLLRMAEISVDIDSLAATVGELVPVQNDVPQWGEGGRAVSGSTTSVALDHPVTLAPAATYQIMVRLADDTIATRTITTAAGTVSAVAWASALPSAVAQYDPWAIGLVGQVMKPFVVTAIRRAQDQRARLSLIEYNESIYGFEAGIPALATPNISTSAGFGTILLTNPKPGSPEPANPSDHLVLGADGGINTFIELHWWFSDRSKTRKTHIAWAQSGTPWHFVTTQDDSLLLGPVTDGAEYTIYLACENYLGQIQPWTGTQKIIYYPIGKLAPPSDVTNFVAVQLADGTRRYTWDAVADADLAGYEIRASATDLAWAAQILGAGSLYVGTSVESRNTVISAGNWYFHIKAVDTSGNASANATQAASYPTNFANDPDDPVLNANVTLTAAGALVGGGGGTVDLGSVAGTVTSSQLSSNLDAAGKTILKDFTLASTDYSGSLRAGTITWNTSTGAITGGSGVVIHKGGILGAASGVATFTLDATTGAATFAGSLSAASGTFAGDIDTTGYIHATGGSALGGGYATLQAIPATTNRHAVYAEVTGTGYGIWSKAFGSGAAGVFDALTSGSGTGNAVQIYGNASNPALYINPGTGQPAIIAYGPISVPASTIGTPASGEGRLAGNSTFGLLLSGRGSSYDVAIGGYSGIAAWVPTGTQIFEVLQALRVPNNTFTSRGITDSATATALELINSTVPAAPTIGTAVAGNASASVAFTAPTSDGGESITGYTATSNPGSITGTGSSSPITVSGLTNGTNYTFTVHATNANGDSSESSASNSVTPAVTDPYWSNVSLYLQMNGTNGSTTFTDSSSNNHSITASGAGIALTTTNPKAGTAAADVTTTGGYITLPASVAFVLGTGDFTLEWFERSAGTGSAYFGRAVGASTYDIQVGYSTDVYRWALGSVVASGAMTGRRDGNYHHIAVVRVSGTISWYFDGVLSGTPVYDTSTIGSSSGQWILLGTNTVSQIAVYDELRLTKGIGRYTTDFTPPTPPYPTA
jgi:hypothetical protein